MALGGRKSSPKRSRYTLRQVNRSQVGTHVTRGAHASGQSRTGTPARDRSSALASRRAHAQASRNQVDVLLPETSSGESARAYRRRTDGSYLRSVRRRAMLRRVLVALVAVAIVAGIAVGAGMLAFRGTVGSSLSLVDSDAESALVQVRSDEPYYALVTAELGAVASPLDHDGPDVILLARVDRQAHELALANIPASLKTVVDNDTRRLGDMADDGDSALIAAVESFAKVDVSHYAKLSAGGLAGMVDALGGIEVDVGQVIDDPHAGDTYFPQGSYTMNGSGAVTYLRATNLRLGEQDQYANQVKFAALLLTKLFGSEGGLTARLESVAPYLQTDYSLADLEELGSWVGSLAPDAIACEVLSGYTSAPSDVVDGTEALYVSTAQDAADLIAAMSGEAPASDAEGEGGADGALAAEPGSFTVEVQNGTDIVGAANTTANVLAQLGFSIDKAGNAEQQVYDETLVVYRTDATRSSAQGSALDELYGNAGEGAGEEGWYDEGYDDYDEGYGDGDASDKKASEAAEQARQRQVVLGKARAEAVIAALGTGRAVEGDMYYSFDADVLVIIGADYKPVA